MSSRYFGSMLHDDFYILQVWACNLRETVISNIWRAAESLLHSAHVP